MGEKGPPGDRREREVTLGTVESEARALSAGDEHRADTVLSEQVLTDSERVPVAGDIARGARQADDVRGLQIRVRQLIVGADELSDQPSHEHQVDGVELSLESGACIPFEAFQCLDQVFLPGVFESFGEIVHRWVSGVGVQGASATLTTPARRSAIIA